MPEREPAVVVLIANFADRVGGGEESLLTLAQGLDRARFAPRVVVPAPGEVSDALQAAAVPWGALGLPPLRPWTLPAVVGALGRLTRLLRAWRAALVHPQGGRGALYAGLAARRLGLPMIWHVRIVDPDPWLDPLLVRLATRIVANSHAAAGRLARHRAAVATVRVVANGVDVERFRPRLADPELRLALGLPPRGPVIGYIGRLEQGKGPDVLLEAAARLHARCPDACFLFVGDGPLRDTLQTRAKHAGVPAVFSGRRTDLEAVLNVCTIVAVPSRQEAFGRVVIEAMASEVPVVASRVGGLPEVCAGGRTGVLVRPDDPAALADALEAVLSDAAATRARVRAAAEDIRRHYTLGAHVAGIERVYGEVL